MSKSTKEIKNFWQENPVGENLVPRDKDWENHFKNYDDFRYKTEGHILSELDSIDFKNKKVLEIGVGQASDSYQIAIRGGIWHGLDLTDAAKERAQKRFEIANQPYGEVKVGSATEIPWPDDYFDIVYSHGVLHHIPNIKKTQTEISRVLKTQGKLVIMLYHKSSLNYWISILLIRRLGLLIISLLNKLKLFKPNHDTLIGKHLKNAKQFGIFKYLKPSNFIHSNTDGPENPYSRVYRLEDMKETFSCLKLEESRCHFINERHFPGIKYLPNNIKKIIERNFGWHIWGYFSNNKG